MKTFIQPKYSNYVYNKTPFAFTDTDCMSIRLTFYILRTNSSVTFNIFSEKYFIQNPWTPIIFTTHVTFSHLRYYNLSFCLHAVVSPNKDVENTLLTTPQKLHSQLLNICSLECVSFLNYKAATPMAECQISTKTLILNLKGYTNK